MELSQYVENNAPLDLSRFLKIKDREFRPGYDLTGLKYLRLQAGRERDLRELYRDRAPYELLQNADDARAKAVVFILSDDGLAFAHSGNWFTVANFRSLADGWSDKDPDQCIGHKGLGFRSVLDLTPCPHLLSLSSKEFLAIKFAWALNNGHFQEVFKRDSSLKSHHGDCPVMSIPGVAKKQGLGGGETIYDRLMKGFYGDHTTLFWLPISDPDIPNNALAELSPVAVTEKSLREFLTDEVSILLPFLKYVEKVLLFRKHERVASVALRGSRNSGVVSVLTDDEGNRYSQSFFQMQFSFPIPPNISVDPKTPKAVRALKSAGVTLSVPLTNNQPDPDEDSAFHVYFPTEEETGLGFVVHGDFYVKPDRTRLMTAPYNDWLLRAAGQKAANEFLTELTEHYDTSAIFRSLAPTGEQNDAAAILINAFSESLAKRKRAFIPSNVGALTSNEAVLPPSVDSLGFWDSHFSDAAPEVLKEKKAFVLPTIDSTETRKFLRLAQVDVVDSEQLLDLIEAAEVKTKPMSWWYDCYTFLSQSALALNDHTYFSGRQLIPVGNKSVLSVGENRDLVVCLPPRGDSKNLQVPPCFSSSFVFLDPALARLIINGKDSVRTWVLDRFHISRFEASDLLPRAIRNVAPKIYDGTIALTRDELKDIWIFVFKVIQLSRAPIEEVDFWQNIGRLPLPSENAKPGGGELTPAFLLYWGDRQRSEALIGIHALKAVSTKFVDELVTLTDVSKKDWLAFFNKAGVSNSPQFRSYSRVIGSDSEIPLNESVTRADSPYSGERQRDLNRAVIACVHDEWAKIVKSVPKCVHDSKQVLQSLGVIEGFDESLEIAER